MRAPVGLRGPKIVYGHQGAHRCAPVAFRTMTRTTCAVGEAIPGYQRDDIVYLDWNATTPIFPEVTAAMQPFFSTSFGNPSSSHLYAKPTREALARAREAVARVVNAPSDDAVVFVSCGTEADNWAIWGVCMHARKARGPGFVPHVVSTAIEHPAVIAFLEEMKGHGLLDYSLARVDGRGIVSPDDVESAMRDSTVLVTVMHSNNEVGSVQDIAAIAEKAHARGALVHTDAAQSLGKVPVDMEALGADLITVVGHKFGAPKGIAALVIAPHVEMARMLSGGGQEQGRRAGTENVGLAVGMGTAAEIVLRELPETAAHMRKMRDIVVGELKDALRTELGAGADGVVTINGPSDESLRLPNTASVSLRGVDAGALLATLGRGAAEEGGRRRVGVAASAGAACHSGGGGRSGVLAAMGIGEGEARGTVRLSVGRHTTERDAREGGRAVGREAAKQLKA